MNMSMPNPSLQVLGGTYANGVEAFQKLLLADIQKKAKFKQNNETVYVKLSGQFIRFSQEDTYIALSYTICEDRIEVLSDREDTLIAMLQADLNYHAMRSGFEEVLREINKMCTAPMQNCKGKMICIKFVLGGNYEFLNIFSGLCGAFSAFPCLYCRIMKTEIWDTSKPKTFYRNFHYARTIAYIKQRARTTNSMFSVVNPPLLDMYGMIDYIVFDESALLQVIPEVLLVKILESMEIQLQMMKPKKKRKKLSAEESAGAEADFIARVVQVCTKCGVPAISMWKDTRTNVFHVSSMKNSDIKLLLKNMPHYLPELIEDDCLERMIQLWQLLGDLYALFNVMDPTVDMPTGFYKLAKQWVETFVECYGQVNLRPELHLIIYHVPHFLKKFRAPEDRAATDDLEEEVIVESTKEMGESMFLVTTPEGCHLVRSEEPEDEEEGMMEDEEGEVHSMPASASEESEAEEKQPVQQPPPTEKSSRKNSRKGQPRKRMGDLQEEGGPTDGASGSGAVYGTKFDDVQVKLEPVDDFEDVMEEIMMPKISSVTSLSTGEHAHKSELQFSDKDEDDKDTNRSSDERSNKEAKVKSKGAGRKVPKSEDEDEEWRPDGKRPKRKATMKKKKYVSKSSSDDEEQAQGGGGGAVGKEKAEVRFGKKYECKECGIVFRDPCMMAHHRSEHFKKAVSYNCAYCGEVVPSYYDLIRNHETCRKAHVIVEQLIADSNAAEEGKKLHVCSLCKKKFLTAKELDAHNIFHTTPGLRNMSCQVCGITENSYEELVANHKKCKANPKHMMEEDRKVFPCLSCHHVFRSKAALETHKSSHQSQNLNLHCRACGITENTYSDYHRKHLLCATSPSAAVKVFSCKFCPRKFTSEVELEKHSYSHKIPDVNVLFCPSCNTSETKMSVFLARHKDCAPLEKDGSYSCNICRRKFQNKAQLKLHYRHHSSHVTQLHLSCEMCGVVEESEAALLRNHRNCLASDDFTKSYSLEEIEKNIPPLKKFKPGPPAASKNVPVKSKVQKSPAVKIKKEEFSCSGCGEVESSAKDLQKNHASCTGSDAAQSIPNYCNDCSLQFESRSEYKTHREWHLKTRDLVLVCDVCGVDEKSYEDLQRKHATCQLIQQQKGAGDEEIFACTICNKKVQNKTALEEHVLFHITPLHPNWKPPKTSCKVCKLTFEGTEPVEEIITHMKGHF